MLCSGTKWVLRATEESSIHERRVSKAVGMCTLYSDLLKDVIIQL